MRQILVGDVGTFTKMISADDIDSYADITGDFNPIHVNEEIANKTVFKRRIAHGMFVGGLVSTVIGNIMPGFGTVYLEQDLKFRAPVYIGDVCTAQVTVTEILNSQKGIYKLDTKIMNQNNIIVSDGYAVIKYLMNELEREDYE